MVVPSRSDHVPPQYARAADTVLSTLLGKSTLRVKAASLRTTTAAPLRRKSGDEPPQAPRSASPRREDVLPEPSTRPWERRCKMKVHQRGDGE
jgi:hypothetical protein